MYFKSNAGRKKKVNNEGEKKKKSKRKDEEKTKIEKEKEKKNAAEGRKICAKKYAERIEENKKRTRQESKKRKLNGDSNFARTMYNAQMFKRLGLSHISPNIHNRFQLNADDVLGFYNPKGDGHCGWRPSSVLLNGNEEHYETVKKLTRYTRLDHKEHYERTFGKEGYIEKLAAHTHTGSITSQRLWFDALDCSRLLAEAYHRLVIVYTVPNDPNLADQSINGVTFLPIFSEYQRSHSNDKHVDAAPVVLFLNRNNFQLIVVKDEAIERVIWPKISPGYVNLVTKRGLSE